MHLFICINLPKFLGLSVSTESNNFAHGAPAMSYIHSREQMCISSPKNHPTIPGNKKNLQASSLGQTKKCPWWNVQESHLSPQRPQPATDPREPGERVWEAMPNGKKEGASAKLLHWSSLNSDGNTILLDFRSHAVPCWYSESWKFFRFDELFWECDKAWLYFHDILPRVGTWSGGVGNKGK